MALPTLIGQTPVAAMARCRVAPPDAPLPGKAVLGLFFGISHYFKRKKLIEKRPQRNGTQINICTWGAIP